MDRAIFPELVSLQQDIAGIASVGRIREVDEPTRNISGRYHHAAKQHLPSEHTHTHFPGFLYLIVISDSVTEREREREREG